MTIPDMGHLISSFYQVVLVHLSIQQCLTFLPLRSTPTSVASRKEICIGFVNNNHFVQLILEPGHPIPPIATNWRSAEQGGFVRLVSDEQKIHVYFHLCLFSDDHKAINLPIFERNKLSDHQTNSNQPSNQFKPSKPSNARHYSDKRRLLVRYYSDE
ncbi:uncharacterized protein LOC114275367 [Camellia sinensis]|uniref:uncharacterized protein LOC114275367 n=1 Tax=Camellia sinensis TaxID=4442 RepID=UPI001036582B|nr:uncharacterized protein LOC114275367 [Camellia sinensis]